MRKAGLFAVMLTAAVLAGCSDDELTGGGGEGRLRINLTDAPGDLEDAFVKIEKIVLIRRDADSLADSTSSGRINITPDVTGYINLLDLTGGKLLELADTAGIPEGTYSQLRVIIDEAYVTLKDGRVFATSGATLPAGVTADGELKCPSCAQSGFKVKFSNGGMTVNGTSTVTIDFDAGQSFGHEAGNSGKWVMRPVLRATATNITFGRITGNVALATGVTIPACGGQNNNLTAFKPFAVLGTDTLSGTTDTLGVYRIANAVPGTYTLGFVKDVTFTNGDSLTIAAAPSVATLAVVSADSAKANYQVTAATCH
jgi:hypothetical protein